MKPIRCFALALLIVTTSAHAIIIRSGVPDAKYLVPASTFPALADLPMEGHGTLIAKRWVVTAAHAVRMMRAMPQHRFVTIAGKRRKVVRIVLYPDYQASAARWDQLVKNMQTEDAATWMVAYASVLDGMHDIALLELAKPVEDVKPAHLSRGSDEAGHMVAIVGKGATGNSLAGSGEDAPHRTELRRAYNRIVAAKHQWLYYKFDCSSDAVPLEGVTGNGDSGGPVLIQEGGMWKLAGITHGLNGTKADLLAMRAGKFRMGLCGQEFSSTRVSFYARWIDSVIAGRVRAPE